MTTICVTGAASGIGRACRERFEAGGSSVISVDLREAEVTADLSTVEGRDRAVNAVTERCEGRLDALVTCAGLAGAPTLAGSTLALVNYFGTVELLEGLRPALAAARGAAVAISSNSTTVQPGLPRDLTTACLAGDLDVVVRLADEVGSMLAYPAVKMAVARWVRRQAVTNAWVGSGIRLNAIAPGMIDTPMVEAGRNDPELRPLFDLLPIPTRRLGRAVEIAALIDLLVGPDGGFFCGSVIFCDGGSDAALRGEDWPAAWTDDYVEAMAAFDRANEAIDDFDPMR